MFDVDAGEVAAVGSKEICMMPFSDVSRETIEKLEIYEALIRKWNPVINLVSRSTLEHLWERHFLDSLDVFRSVNGKPETWVDLGSGGGFPGAIVALLAADAGIATKVTCIEADIRKCEFLRNVSRATAVPFKVISRRIEDAPKQDADVVSARALTGLTNLLTHCERHLSPDGIAVLPKGETWKDEVEAARKIWHFDIEAKPSSTNPTSAILRIGNIQRV